MRFLHQVFNKSNDINCCVKVESYGSTLICIIASLSGPLIICNPRKIQINGDNMFNC